MPLKSTAIGQELNDDKYWFVTRTITISYGLRYITSLLQKSVKKVLVHFMILKKSQSLRHFPKSVLQEIVASKMVRTINQKGCQDEPPNWSLASTLVWNYTDNVQVGISAYLHIFISANLQICMQECESTDYCTYTATCTVQCTLHSVHR